MSKNITYKDVLNDIHIKINKVENWKCNLQTFQMCGGNVITP